MNQQWIRGVVDARPVATFFVLAYAFSWIGWLPAVIGMAEPIRTLQFCRRGIRPRSRRRGGDVARQRVRPGVGSTDRPLAGRTAMVSRCIRPPLLVVGLASVAITLLGTTVDPTVLSGRLSLVFGSYVFVALIGGETRNRAGEVRPPEARGTVRADPGHAHCRCRLGVLAPSSAGRGSERCLQFRMARRGDPRDHPSHHQYRGLRVPPDVDLQRNRGVLLALLLHAGINTANSTLVPLPIEAITGESFMTVLIAVDIAVWVVAIVLIVATRGRLGYDTSRNPAGRQEAR